MMAFPGRLALIAMVGTSLVACGAKDDVESSRAVVEKFHVQLNDSRFSEIYREASPIFREKSTEEELNKLLGSIRIQLGKVTNTQSEGLKIDYGTDGSEATLTYRTAFEKGTAIETFVFDVSAEPPRLAGYHIASQ
jgi:hypothetical protein